MALLALRSAGSRVVRAIKSQLAATVADSGAAGGEAEYVVTDLTDVASIQKAIRFTVDTFGRLDLAMNNGGISVPTSRSRRPTRRN